MRIQPNLAARLALFLTLFSALNISYAQESCPLDAPFGLTGDGKPQAVNHIRFEPSLATVVEIKQTSDDESNTWWRIGELKVFAQGSDTALDRNAILFHSSEPKRASTTRAFDNNQQSYWQTGEKQRNGHSFTFALRDATNIDCISLHNHGWKNDYPRGYEVSIWATMDDYLDAKGGAQSLEFPQQTANYLRLIQTGNSRSQWWSIYELEIFNKEAKIAPDFEKWIATASHQSHPSRGEQPEKAIDGKPSSRWATGASQTEGQYFQLDFGSQIEISKVRAVSANSDGGNTDYPEGLRVELSLDGRTWFDPNDPRARPAPLSSPAGLISESHFLEEEQLLANEHKHHISNTTNTLFTPRISQAISSSASNIESDTPTIHVAATLAGGEDFPSQGFIAEVEYNRSTEAFSVIKEVVRPECKELAGVQVSPNGDRIAALCRSSKENARAQVGIVDLVQKAIDEGNHKLDNKIEQDYMLLYEWPTGDIATEPKKSIVSTAIGGFANGQFQMRLVGNRYVISLKTVNIFNNKKGEIERHENAVLIFYNYETKALKVEIGGAHGHPLNNYLGVNEGTKEALVMYLADSNYNHESNTKVPDFAGSNAYLSKGNAGVKGRSSSTIHYHQIQGKPLKRVKGGVGPVVPYQQGFRSVIVGSEADTDSGLPEYKNESGENFERPLKVGLLQFDGGVTPSAEVKWLVDFSPNMVSLPRLALLENGHFLIGAGVMNARVDEGKTYAQMHNDLITPEEFWVAQIDANGEPVSDPISLGKIGWGENDDLISLGRNSVFWASRNGNGPTNELTLNVFTPKNKLETKSIECSAEERVYDIEANLGAAKINAIGIACGPHEPQENPVLKRLKVGAPKVELSPFWGCPAVRPVLIGLQDRISSSDKLNASIHGYCGDLQAKKPGEREPGQCPAGQILSGLNVDFNSDAGEVEAVEAICKSFIEEEADDDFEEVELRESIKPSVPRDDGKSLHRRACEGQVDFAIVNSDNSYRVVKSYSKFVSVGSANTKDGARREARDAVGSCLSGLVQGKSPGEIGACNNQGVWRASDTATPATSLSTDIESLMGPTSSVYDNLLGLCATAKPNQTVRVVGIGYVFNAGKYFKVRNPELARFYPTGGGACESTQRAEAEIKLADFCPSAVPVEPPTPEPKVRTLREASMECFDPKDPQGHDCVNLAYRRSVASHRMKPTIAIGASNDLESNWGLYATDGFVGNESANGFVAKVDADAKGGAKPYRLTVDLGKEYDSIKEVELIPPSDKNSNYSITVRLLDDGRNEVTSNDINGVDGSDKELSIIEYAGADNVTGMTARFVELSSDSAFEMDEVLVLTKDPFLDFRSGAGTASCTTSALCSISSFGELIEAIGMFWGNDLHVNTAISQIGKSQKINITSADLLPLSLPDLGLPTTASKSSHEALNIGFDLFIDSTTSVKAYISTILNDSGAYELILAFEIPSVQQTWSALFSGASNLPENKEFGDFSKILVPIGATLDDSDGGPVDIEFDDFSAQMKTFINSGTGGAPYNGKTLNLERGINLLTRLKLNDLPTSVGQYVGNTSNSDIVISGGLGLTGFSWGAGSSWVVPTAMSLKAYIPVHASATLKDVDIQTSQITAQIRLVQNSLVVLMFSDIEFKYGDQAKAGSLPTFNAGAIAEFGSNNQLSLQASLVNSWDKPFGIDGAKATSFDLNYELQSNGRRHIFVDGQLSITDGKHNSILSAFYESRTSGRDNSSWSASLSMVNPPSSEGHFSSVVKNVTGSPWTLPTWLNSVSNVSVLINNNKVATVNQTNYRFRAGVKVCYQLTNNKPKQVAWASDGSCPYTQADGELELSFSNDKSFDLSVRFNFHTSATPDADKLDFSVGGQNQLPTGGSNVVSDIAGNFSISNCKTGAGCTNVSASITGQVSTTDASGTQTIGFELDVTSGSTGTSAGVSFTYKMIGVDCDALKSIAKSHDSRIDTTSTCNTQIPSSSGHHAHTGFSLSNFELHIRALGTASYMTIQGDGEYVFADGSTETFDALVGLSGKHFAVGFDVSVAGNIGDLFGMKSELGGDSKSTGVTNTDESDLAVFIANDLSSAPSAFVSEIESFLATTALAKRSSSITKGGFHVDVYGRLPEKMIDHLDFLGIHNNLNVNLYLDISTAELAFGGRVITVNCEYFDGTTSGCENFEDITDENQYPDWFNSADMELDFTVSRAAKSLSVRLGGDLVIHENENEKTGAGPEDIRLHAQLGFDTSLATKKAEIEICATLAAANTTTGRPDAPSAAISTNSCSYSHDSAQPFAIHGIEKLKFSELGFELKISPVRLDVKAFGGVELETNGDSIDVDLKELAFSISTETGVPLGGSIDLSTNAKIKGEQIIALFNHHNSHQVATASTHDLSLNTDSEGNDHLFSKLEMVGLLDPANPRLPSKSESGISEIAVAFGDLGNRFTFSTGFLLEDKPLGIVDLHLSLSQIHFFGDLYLEPLMGSRFKGLKEELRVDVDTSQLIASGSIEIPKPHLIGDFHKVLNLASKAECKIGNAVKNVFDAFTHFKNTTDCNHHNDANDTSGNPQEIYSLRGDITITSNKVEAQATLDDVKCSGPTCSLTKEYSVLFGLVKKQPISGVTIAIPYLHFVGEISPSTSRLSFSEVNTYFNQRITNNVIEADGRAQLDLLKESDLLKIQYQSFGDLDGDGAADSIVIAQMVNSKGETEFPMLYKLAHSAQWHMVENPLYKVTDEFAAYMFSFPDINAGRFDTVFDKTAGYNTLSAFQLHNVDPRSNGDELVMLVRGTGFANQWILICKDILTSGASCEVSASQHGASAASVHNQLSDAQLLAMDFDGDGVKSLVLPIAETAGGDTALSISYFDQANKRFNTAYHQTSVFPDQAQLGFIGKIPGSDPASSISSDKSIDRLLVFNDSDGVSTKWELYECLNKGEVCATWKKTIIRKSTEEPARFYFGDFDGDGWDDVLNVDINGSFGGSGFSVTGTVSSSAKSTWKEIDSLSTDLSQLLLDAYPCMENTTCGPQHSQDVRKLITSGRGKEGGELGTTAIK